ncbi:MAG: MATE family efflux transporter [Acutalibacteraceae bacterium]|nr:MATE family efflux transporter [Acutalibacteraceae bacterium]
MVKDLTVGKPMKQVLGIFAPMLFTTVFQQLYSITDTMIVGKFISKDALAAVGSTGNLNWLLISFIIGFSSAESVIVSTEFGKKDFNRMKISIANGIYVLAVTGALVTVLSAVFCGNMLKFLNTPDDIFDDAYTYFFIVILGFPLSVGSNYIASIMRSVGDSKIQMIIGIVSAFVNVFLDLLFVICFGWGVFGVAIATFIAQVINFITYFTVYLKCFPELHLSKDNFKIDKTAIIKTITLGLPMGLQSSITSIGCTMIQSAVNSLGTVYVAAFTTAVRLENLLSTPIVTFSSSIVPFIAQNYGALRYDRINKILKQSLIIAITFGIVVGSIYALFGDKIALMYINSYEVETLSLIGYYSSISGWLLVLLCVLNIIRSYIQALGYSLFTAIGGIVELSTRACITFFLISKFGFTIICLSNPLSWVFTDLFLILSYFIYIKRKAFNIIKE